MTGLRKVRLYSKLFFKKSKKYWNCSFGKFIFFDKLHSTETQEYPILSFRILFSLLVFRDISKNNFFLIKK